VFLVLFIVSFNEYGGGFVPYCIFVYSWYLEARIPQLTKRRAVVSCCITSSIVKISLN
jgi:hypothetical protein